MSDMHDRLQAARTDAGFEKASDAARALGIPEPTYLGHENGSRGFKARAEQYARRFGVSLEWLLTGRGQRRVRTAKELAENPFVPLVGFVGAGAQANFYGEGQGPFEEVPAPDDATDSTVAVEIRGDSMGPLFDGWIVYYDDVRRPVTADLIGKICVVGLPDGRVLIKKLQRSKARGLFHLLSQNHEPIMDVPIDWAAMVKDMKQR